MKWFYIAQHLNWKLRLVSIFRLRVVFYRSNYHCGDGDDNVDAERDAFAVDRGVNCRFVVEKIFAAYLEVQVRLK